MKYLNGIAETFRKSLTCISPMLNTKVTYWFKFHKKLDLNNPITLNEKIQWLKMNTYLGNPLVKQCADKYMVRKYIANCGLTHILNDLIAVYETPNDIEWDKLPEEFALKLNVGCGYNHIVSQYQKEDKEKLKEEVKKWFKDYKTQWLSYSEMQYKDVKPYILVEKFLGNSMTGTLPEDYKVYCFNGEPQFIMVCVGREAGTRPKFYFFDNKWHLARINRDSKAAPENFTIEKPACFDELMSAAKCLAKPFPFVRVDFFTKEGCLIFGELTFTPAGGMDTGRLPETDILMGTMLRLPTDKKGCEI